MIMKMLMIVVDETRREQLEVALEEAGVAGYTELSHATGAGATGLRLGSRAFPRTSAVVFSMVGDEAVEPLRARLRAFCADCGERMRLVVWDAQDLGLAP
jgi:hypothetical protein